MAAADVPTDAAVRAALQRVLDTDRLLGAPRVREFLEFVVEEGLAGRGSALKAYTIATGAFRYPDDFDPRTDPYVRIVAGRVRRSLASYYSDEGKPDPVRIEIPKGTYAPTFRRTPLDEIVESRYEAGAAITGVAICRFEYGGATERQWLASGLTEELLGALGRFEELRVLGPLTEGAVVEAASFYLSGSVHAAESKVRVSVRLTDSAGTHLWAESYDRDLSDDDLFALQDDIAQRVVGAVGDGGGVIARTLGRAARRVPAEHASSYEAVLKAYHWANVLTDVAFHDACNSLRRAVDKTPDFALARALLSDLHFSDWLSGIGFLEGGLDAAETLAREAVDLEPRSAQSRWALGQVHFGRRRPELLEGEYELALELAPYRSSTAASYAMCLVGLRDWERAATMQQRAARLNPELPAWTRYADFMLSAQAGEWTAALKHGGRFEPSDLIWGPLCRAVALANLDELDKAAVEISELTERHPRFAAHGLERMRRLLWHEANVKLFVDGLGRCGLELQADGQA